MRYQIYCFYGVGFSKLPNGLLGDLKNVTKVINNHIPSCKYYFISTISPISKELFSGEKEELTHIYLKSSGKLVKLSSIS